jgi:hypothetical protein
MTEPAAPPAAEDSGSSPNNGITLVTALKWWGPPVLRVLFLITRFLPELKGLEPFRSVHFTRWSILRSLPYNGPPQVRERPEQPYLVWESMYSAEVEPYIEAFVAGISAQIERTWGSSYGFPGTGSITRLHRYIEQHAVAAQYTYKALPEESVQTALAALEVAKEHALLVEAAGSGSSEEFAMAYQDFLRRRGADL